MPTPATDSMTEWAPRRRLQGELERLDSLLQDGPATPDRLCSRAALLHALGRLEEAKAGYVAVLQADARHLPTLTQLGALLHETGYRSAAVTVHRRLIALDPGNAAPHAGLGHVLWEHEDHEGARAEYEAALALDPDCAQAHQGMAAVLRELRQDEAALAHAKRGYSGRQVLRLPYFGTGEPVRLLVLASSNSGNVPIGRVFDEQRFQTTLLFTEFQDLRAPLPRHDLVFNAVGDADTGAEALALAQALAEKTRAPVLNPPEKVARTGRAANARRLAGIPGLVVPRVEDFSRAELEAPDAEARLRAASFAFPLLLRARGFHAGKHFAKVADAGGLAAALQALPGDAFTVLEFLDARGADGKVRKYRVMMVGGELHPLHAAVSADWKVHYFSADMRDNPAHRAEDRAFLEDMPGALGPKALAALRSIRDALGLDYAGCDFSLNAAGEVLFYEANATMIIPRPDAGGQWDYRRAPVQRVLDAVNALLLERARPGAAG